MHVFFFFSVKQRLFAPLVCNSPSYGRESKVGATHALRSESGRWRREKEGGGEKRKTKGKTKKGDDIACCNHGYVIITIEGKRRNATHTRSEMGGQKNLVNTAGRNSLLQLLPQQTTRLSRSFLLGGKAAARFSGGEGRGRGRGARRRRRALLAKRWNCANTHLK